MFKTGFGTAPAMMSLALAATLLTIWQSPPEAVTPLCPAGYEVRDTAAWTQKLNPLAPEAAHASLLKQYGPRLCVSTNAPESLQDYLTSKDAAGLPRTAPFDVMPPGALSNAHAQKQAMEKAGLTQKVAGAAGTWAEYGTGPLIANDPDFGHT